MSRKTLIGLIGGVAVSGIALAVAAPIIRKRALRVTTLLKKDHRVVSGLFFTLQQAPSAALRKSIFSQIQHQLEIHSQAEEEIFYPAVRNLYTNTAQQEVAEAKQEHSQIRNVLHQASTMDPDSYQFMSKCNELEELVNHHVEEEEGEMFQLAIDNMSSEELDHLGRRIHDRKVQLKERIAA